MERRKELFFWTAVFLKSSAGLFFLAACSGGGPNLGGPNFGGPGGVGPLQWQANNQAAGTAFKGGGSRAANDEDVKNAVQEVAIYELIERQEIKNKNKRGWTQISLEKKIKKTVVSHGTGFFIAPHFLVTNFHVVANSQLKTEIQLINLEGDRFIKARLVQVSALYDLALLKSEEPSASPLLIRTQALDPEKEALRLFGYPDNRFVKANLSFLKEMFDGHILEFSYQKALGSLSGASGGPVMDARGLVAGVHHAGSTSMNRANIISLKALNAFLNGDGRRCSSHAESCIDAELDFLDRKRKEGHPLLQYIHETLKVNNLFEKRELYQEFLSAKNRAFDAAEELTEAVNQFNRFISRFPKDKDGSIRIPERDYRRAEELLEEQQEAYEFYQEERERVKDTADRLNR